MPDYQLMIDTEVSKINEVFTGKTLTISQLVKDYNPFTSRKDFLTFYPNNANE